MLLIYISAIVLISLVLMALRRDRGSVLTFLTALSLSEFIFFVLMFIAKHRGFSARMEAVFFLTRGIDDRLRYTIILLNQLGFLLALGRCLFPMFMVMLAALTATFLDQAHRRYIYLLSPILPVLTLIGYYRPVFQWITELSPAAQRFFVQFSFAWCVVYTLAAVAISLIEAFRTSIRLIRRRHLQKVAMVLGFAGVYLLYCRQDPAQAYMFYQDSYMSGLGLWYLSPIMSYSTHLILILLVAASTAASTVYMIRVGAREVALKQQTQVSRSKFDMAKYGGNIFVHGIKNQLLAAQTLCRRFEEEAALPQPDPIRLRADAQSLDRTLAAMTGHVNQLYRSFREPKLRLRETSVEEVLTDAERAVRHKYPDARIERQQTADHPLLADREYLAEALGNLLMNAWEANVSFGRTDQPVTVRCYISQIYTVVEISDHGPGIPKAKRRRIFEPFYTDKNTNQNWGMGLYLTSQIVRRHLGQLEVSSEPGQGAVFYVMLPAYGKETA
ncbi:MAG: HAMP domain-containing histidine kinase [Clostridia bacterium]|nr:HAMP domain-containing histidine kinase [Clostridia bacterium]